MAWMDHFDKVPSRTLYLAGWTALLAAAVVLGVGIASASVADIFVALGIILAAGLVPSLVDVRDTKRRVKEAARREAVPAAIMWPAAEWDMENIERESGGLVWIEPQAERYRLH
jgi:hypothetical protein